MTRSPSGARGRHRDEVALPVQHGGSTVGHGCGVGYIRTRGGAAGGYGRYSFSVFEHFFEVRPTLSTLWGGVEGAEGTLGASRSLMTERRGL